MFHPHENLATALNKFKTLKLHGYHKRSTHRYLRGPGAPQLFL